MSGHLNFVYPAILIAEIWQWTPFMFLLLLAALTNVDKSQLEAAEIDGAGFWRTFTRMGAILVWRAFFGICHIASFSPIARSSRRFV